MGCKHKVVNFVIYQILDSKLAYQFDLSRYFICIQNMKMKDVHFDFQKTKWTVHFIFN